MNIDSILQLYKKNYFNLPRSVRSFLGSVYGTIPLEIRFGRHYSIHNKIIEVFENSDEQFRLDFIFNKTFETINFAYENIPFYTKTFNENGFKPQHFKSLEDLKMVPYLTKKEVQNDLENLYTSKFDKPVAVQTGGSTFTPTKFYNSLNVTRAKERAYNNYIFSKIGYTYRDKTLVIRDKDFSNEKKGIYWGYEMVANQLWLSPNHINRNFIAKILKEIEIFKPKFIWAYPHMVTLFIKECQRLGIQKLEGISGIFLTSEMVFQEELERARFFFDCKVISHYGHRESTTIAYRIDDHKYNFLNSYGATRIVDNEIITTSFDNFVMPFINYKTQDYVIGNIEFLNNLDIANKIQNIEGRLQDFIVLKDNTLRTATSIGTGHFENLQYVEAGQYYQDTPGRLTVFFQSINPEKVRVQEFIQEFEKDINHTLTIDVKFVDKIHKTPLGKWKTVIQKLDIEKYK